MRSKYCLLMLPAAAVMLSSCSIIDEDNSDCGLDNKIVYRLKLRTNIQTAEQRKRQGQNRKQQQYHHQLEEQ